MSRVIHVGSAEAKPGMRVTGEILVPNPIGEVSIPVIIINGREEGPILGITGGIHGAEYNPIDAVIRLGQDINCDQLQGALILIPIANQVAFYARSIYVNPVDGKNPNREFPGMAKGTLTQILVYTLVHEFFQKIQYYIDMHSGDMSEMLIPFASFPTTGDEAVDAASEELARVFGLDIIGKSGTVGSSYAASAGLGRPSILAEAGGRGILDAESSQILYQGALNIMTQLHMLDGPPPKKCEEPLIKFSSVSSEHKGLFYKEVVAGDTVKEGQKMGLCCNVYGDRLSEVISPADGKIIYMLNSLAVNAGETLLAVGTHIR